MEAKHLADVGSAVVADVNSKTVAFTAVVQGETETTRFVLGADAAKFLGESLASSAQRAISEYSRQQEETLDTLRENVESKKSDQQD